MNFYQIALVVIGLICAIYLIWCLIRATRYMRNYPEQFGWPSPDKQDRQESADDQDKPSSGKLLVALITILMMVSAKPMMADDSQPRFMIPSAQVLDKGLYGYSYITEDNPFFTVYLWYGNSDWDDSYWVEAPVLTIDGHSVKLTDLCGNQKYNFEDFTREWMCYEGDKLYYTVYAHDGFEVKSNKIFKNYYEDYFTKSANFGEDFYIILDIYMHENVKGAKHIVSFKGKANIDDDYTQVFDAKTPAGKDTMSCGNTVFPFEYSDKNTTLKWTSPHKLTFTSASFNKKNWGDYKVVYDSIASDLTREGVISVTKDYGSSTNYKSVTPKKVEYRYEGVYDRANPKKRYEGQGVYNLEASKYGSITHFAPKHWELEQKTAWTGDTFCNTEITVDEAEPEVRFYKDPINYKYSYYYSIPEGTKLTIKCLDKKICKVRFIADENSYINEKAEKVVVSEWDSSSNPQSSLTLKFNKNIVASCIEITYDHRTEGYLITFTDTNDKAPESLPYPSNLTPKYNEWLKFTTLTWNSNNTDFKNFKGKYLIFRDGVFKDSVTTVSSNNFTFKDDSVEYNTNYEYKVTYIPTGWSDSDIEDSLSTSATARLNRTVSINHLEAKARTDSYLLKWSISPQLNKSGYLFNIYRKTITADNPNPSISDFDDLLPIGTVKVENNNVLNYTYNDENIATTATYAYLVKIENIQDTTLTAGPIIPDGVPGTSQITSLSASRGTYTDHVHLSWEETVIGSDNLNYDIYRHKINEGENEISTQGDAEQLDWDLLTSLVSSKSNPVTSYEDNTALGGYYYVYAVVARPNGSNDVFTRKVIDGFVRSTGTVYGSVSYADGKYAVQGVKMQLTTGATYNTPTLFNSLGFKGGKGGIHWNVAPKRYNTYFSKAFSVQMYVRPDATNDADACLLDMGKQLRLSLSDYVDNEGYLIAATAGENTVKTTHRIKADQFTHVTFTYDGNGKSNIYLMAIDSLGHITTDSLDLQLNISTDMQGGIAVASSVDSTQTINGYVDEVRFFKRCLTVADVQQNYSHFMGGTESGLVAYWPFDESISTLRWAYDYSKTSDTANENHAAICGGKRNNIEVPNIDQLSLYAVTDTVGSYTLRGIPFAGEGTTYSLVPSKGAHSFTPITRTLYVSPQTLTFDPQNFTDNSSFNVKGVVYYENTTYPVKGCRFRVDDTVVKDEWGNEVLTDDNGEFTIPVSIGEHAIYIEKEGHNFLNKGRYPAEGLHNFNDSISGLTFTDQTKAIVVGRVAGGAREKNKPLGLGLSNANIGAATLTLLTSNTAEDSRRMNVILNSEEGIYDSNTKRLEYENAYPDYVKSSAWVGGLDDGPDAIKYITIQTDKNTGEFAVLLPPVPYVVSTVVDNNQEATVYFKEKAVLDCSDVTRTETVTANDLSITYNTAFTQTYFSAPSISVTQTDNKVGAFGDARVPAGELEDSVNTYTVSDEGVLTYNYGYPIFTSARIYEFLVSAYEKYLNYDENKDHPKEDIQPSTEGYLTFKNPMVLTEDTVAAAQLDSLGEYRYSFQAIEPNEVAPYTQPIDITLTIGDNTYPWIWNYGEKEGGLQCVVFGSKLTGQTSVTSAPDALINIIRDPFGSKSNQVWNDGSTVSKGYKLKFSGLFSMGSNIEAEFGAGIQGGECVPGLFLYKAFGCAEGNSRGVTWKANIDIDGGTTWTHTTTEEFATSTESIYDGPNGDVFVGMSSSLIYGDGLKVMLVNDQEGGYKIGTNEIVAAANKLETTFAYTQDYIINHLIPDYKRLREARLIQVSESELELYRSSFVNNTDSIIYMTSLKSSDPNFGTNNDDKVWGDKAVDEWHLYWNADSLCYYGPSYTAFLPASGKYKNDEEAWDAIVTINSNIYLWEEYLAYNEKAKVNTFLAKNPKERLSFDTGTSYSFVYEEDKTDSGEGTFVTSIDRFHKFGCGVKNDNTWKKQGSFDFNIEVGGGGTLSGSTGEKHSYTVNLADDVADNAHQIEMFDSEGFSYIFRQVSGQTSCYYEGEERTQYYEPGQHILSNATVQVQVPHIDCAEPVVTGVPAGQPAVFNLKLSNATQADLTRYQDYSLLIVKDKWGEMSKVSINDMPGVNEYQVALAPKEAYNLRMEVMPASSEIIHIDSLHLSFYSLGEPELSDDIYLTAHFQPQPEPVKLSASRTLVNTATDSTLVLTASGYNYSSSILNSVRLQQRKAGTPDWTTIHSWVKGTPSGDNESTLPAEHIDTLVDMHSTIFYPDATYEFRAVTDCTVSGEQVSGESETITVIKDVTLPKPIQLPDPSDGVLNEGDNISITFNEDIYSQSLNKGDNFIIQSVLNTDSVAHDVALRLDGSSTPAATSQSQLTLGGTSFTLCSWVKSGDTAGTLFRHGDGPDAFRVNIDADGYLSASIKDSSDVVQTYKSNLALKKNIWSYVGLVYNVKNGTLSAYSASGDEEQTLMSEVPVGTKANSKGNIYLGEGLTGAMHELSLFCTDLTWTTIKAQMYVGKSNSTPSLIGYWRLDEGHGDKSEDRARSRHMILASENGWYMENENFSMNLDGTNYTAIPMGQLSSTEGASYLIEMWALADESQDAGAQLLSLDNGQKLDLNLNNGQLQLVADSVTYNSSTTINNHQWHHVALNVLKGASGQANLIVDGVSVLTVSADKVPALAGAYLWLGRNMKGMLDEVRLWHGTNTQETISERMYYRIDSNKEQTLVGYWPMEDTYYDEYNQRVFEFSLDNKAYQATASTRLTANGDESSITKGQDAPGLKEAPHKSNLDFDFVADERTVSINLEHSAEALEGCTVSTTLRNYYDLNTNVGTPITWSFVVKQNPLSWNTTEVTPRVTAGYNGTFTATLSNNSVADQTWSFTELPSWLEASPSSGTIFAHGTQDVTFTVKQGYPIGKYFATVSARGNKNLDTPLDVCLIIEGKIPDWQAETMSANMTMIGQIKINGIVSTDPDDIIGAFTSSGGNGLGKCIGVASPKYNANKDAYYVSMMVNGTKEMEDETILFRIYDASTGLTYPLTTTSKETRFKVDGSIGTTADPVIWENSDKLLQTISLPAKYQWISLYLEPNYDDLEHLFKPVSDLISSVETSDGKVYTCTDNSWSENLKGIKAGDMMKVTMNGDATLPVIGSPVDPDEYPVTINPGVNWVGVPCQSYMPIDEAFAALAPEEGDIVKNMSTFATFENGKWIGELDAIEPGKGYIYTSQAAEKKEFCFPSNNSSTTGISQWEGVAAIQANYLYPQSMAVVCAVHDTSGQPMPVAAVEAYDESGEMRGCTSRCFRDSLYLFIISGEAKGELIHLRPKLKGSASGDNLEVTLRFNKDKIQGRLKSPVVLQVSATDGITELYSDADNKLTIYNTLGQRLYSGRAAEFDRRKLQVKGIYIVCEETADGQMITSKRINYQPNERK